MNLSSTTAPQNEQIVECMNYVEGVFVSTKKVSDVLNPATGEVVGTVGISDTADVEAAIRSSQKAFPSWSSMTIKARAAIMLKFHALIEKHKQDLAESIVRENGKNIVEALAEVAKGAETVEYACSLPQLAQGKILRVSSGVTCEDRYVPLGVVVSIVPFNFPFMVPMWTIPIALVMGNTVILKPSEKVPITMIKTVGLMEQAGFPPGVLNIVQGTKEAVTALITNPDVQAVTFVGSSPVAKIVATTCRERNKRCTALGGAKNHLVALVDDCDIDSTASDVCVSFAGCAGQRCMAASVLLLVGSEINSQALLKRLESKALSLPPGQGAGQLGPVIDQLSFEKITRYIDLAENDGANIIVDGRSWSKEQNQTIFKNGNWIGPTIIIHKSSNDKTMQEEVFGPVLSVYKCSTWDEAIAIENANPFGNAASIYTTNGGSADWFLTRFRAAMLGT